MAEGGGKYCIIGILRALHDIRENSPKIIEKLPPQQQKFHHKKLNHSKAYLVLTHNYHHHYYFSEQISNEWLLPWFVINIILVDSRLVNSHMELHPTQPKLDYFKSNRL